jgi:MtfA peptidase
MAFMIALGLCLLVLAWLAGSPWWTRRRRRRIASRPFPEAWRTILRRRLPLYARMPPELQRQLRQRIQVFIAEKNFVGCDGLAITDEIRVTIAAQACLLLLNRRGDFFPFLRDILVYPDVFVVDRVVGDMNGLATAQRRVLSGESWTQGKVVLSWRDSVAGAADAADGHNVVIHEFAHQLDQESGVANGSPPLASRDAHDRWARIWTDAWHALQGRLAAGEPTLFGEYGATEPAEFFAVASEVFFERPEEMAQLHAPLYAELATYYRVDPRAWR